MTSTNLHNISDEEKVRLIKIKLDNCDNKDYLDAMYKTHLSMMTKDEPKKEYDKNDKKYVVLLKVLNKILEANGKPPITDIREFRNVSRDDIIKVEGSHELFGLGKEAFGKQGCFDPRKCQWFIRKTTNNYILSFLRGACAEIGADFRYDNKRKLEDKQVSYLIYYTIE